MVKFLTALIFAVWIVAIALISVQNATPVALRFLVFETVQIPVGMVLALCAGLGIVGMAIALPLLRLSK
jgi:Lipopolysaccharide assembly protein A domain